MVNIRDHGDAGRGHRAALPQQLALQTLDEPVTIPALAPSAKADEDMMQRGVVENRDDVTGPCGGQTVAQAALLTDQLGESRGAIETLLADLHPQVGDLGVA